MAGTRRRRLVLLVAVAALFTAVVLVAKGSASSRPNANEAVQAYLDQVRPGVEQSATEGSDFGDVRANALTLGGNGIDRRLDRLEGEVKTTLLSIETLSPPPSLRVAQAYLVAALGVRLKAVTEARPAMDAALTKASSADAGVGNAVSQLYNVAQDLGLGDRAFALFLGALPAASSMPPNQPWISDASQWSTVQLTAFVDRVRSSASATPVHDIAMLAFQTDPGVVSVEADGTEIIPASGTTSVSMVLENVGNQAEHGVNVYVYFTPDGAKAATRSLRDFPDLAPGEMRSITLKPLPTQPGMAGRLDITALPVTGETNTGNNTISVHVVFK
ncbi:MAG TPA: hypothetical protein VMU14_24735 [Acidimicrobiales bacterium]|nr:hypothetical protein [Acidimicrobiales bacterium]